MKSINNYEFFWLSRVFDVTLPLKNGNNYHLWKISYIFMFIHIIRY